MCASLLSVMTDSARLFSFRRPNRGDVVPLDSFSMYLPSTTADSVYLHSFRRSNRGYIVILVAFVLHQGIGDMVILRLRVSLCCILGCILSGIWGFYSDLPPPVPLVLVIAGPPNYGNTGFSVAQIVFHDTITVGFQLPFPLRKDCDHSTTVPTINVPSTVFIPQ